MTAKEKCDIALVLMRHMEEKYPNNPLALATAIVVIGELDRMGYRITPVDFDNPLPEKRRFTPS